MLFTIDEIEHWNLTRFQGLALPQLPPAPPAPPAHGYLCPNATEYGYTRSAFGDYVKICNNKYGFCIKIAAL